MPDKFSLSTARPATGEVLAPTSASARDKAPVPSATLLRGQKAVAITHNGMLYMLQATKLGKLILTK
jgi:hemin uptake protein HemP